MDTWKIIFFLLTITGEENLLDARVRLRLTSNNIEHELEHPYKYYADPLVETFSVYGNCMKETLNHEI